MNILEHNTIQEYIENNPESLHFSILADCLLQAGDIENAEEMSRIGLSLHHKDAEGYFILAKILLSQNKLPEALKQLQNAIKFQPGFIAAHKLLLLYGKEDLSLKEIDTSHKIVENFEKNICKTPEVTLDFLQNESHEEPFLADNDIYNEEELQIQNNTGEMEDNISDPDEMDDELEISEINESDLVETIDADSSDTENNEIVDDASNINIVDQEINDDEIDFELDIPDEDFEEEEPEEIPIENLLIDESDIDTNPDNSFSADILANKENDGLDDEVFSTPTKQDEESFSGFELDIESEENDSSTSEMNEDSEDEQNAEFHNLDGLELDIDEELESILSKKSNETQIERFPKVTNTEMLGQFSLDENTKDELDLLEEKAENVTSDLSIYPVDEPKEEVEEESILKEESTPEQTVSEEIPEFKSTLKDKIDENRNAPEPQKEKINLNIPIPTLTFVEVLKKQKLYDQALEILDILEERSADKDKIIQQKEEIIRLKAEDNY